MAAGGGTVSPLYIYTGVDTTMRLKLVDNTLICQSSGGAGTHEDLGDWSDPPLYLGRAACYFNRAPNVTDDAVAARAADVFTEVWGLVDALPLGFTPSRIASVELLGSGRDGVSVGEASGDCWITWSDDTVTVNDDEGSSSMYCFKINFE